MWDRRWIPAVATTAAGLALVAGVGWLFAMRYAIGDSYAPYSSLRADPLGTRALYESLAALPGVRVERRASPLDPLPTPRGTTLFCLGLDAAGGAWLDQLGALNDERKLDAFVTAGGRLVVTCLPMTERRDFERSGRRDDNATTAAAHGPFDFPPKPTPKPGGEDSTTSHARTRLDDEPETPPPPTRFEDLAPNFAALKWDPDNIRWLPADATLTTFAATADLPTTVGWRSGLAFATHGGAWRPIYEREGRPVALECSYGSGTVVLASDSFFVSNEALRDERHPRLLAWLVGGSSRVLFEETHLGTDQTPGVVGMARQFGLGWAMLVLAALFALYVWHAASRLVPAIDEDEAVRRAGEADLGRDAWSGMIDLLRRNIGEGDILRVCLDEWHHARAQTSPGGAALEAEIRRIVDAQQAIPPGKRNPAAAYEEIVQAIARARRGERRKEEGEMKSLI